MREVKTLSRISIVVSVGSFAFKIVLMGLFILMVAGYTDVDFSFFLLRTVSLAGWNLNSLVWRDNRAVLYW